MFGNRRLELSQLQRQPACVTLALMISCIGYSSILHFEPMVVREMGIEYCVRKDTCYRKSVFE